MPTAKNHSTTKNRLARRRGMLTFEWVLLITVVIIGVVGGLSAARDALIDELGDVSEAALNIDQSYSVVSSGVNVGCDAATDPQGCVPLGTEFGFEDSLPECTDGGNLQTGVGRSRSAQTLGQITPVGTCGPSNP